MKMLPSRFALAACAGLSVISAGLAADRPAAANAPVLELFTSQGCSSCPPADELFKGYAARTDIVALSMPVDYWDYLGWKDTLASSKFTKRQRTYARARGDGQIYTPQVVINGHQHFVGSSKTEIEQALRSTAQTRNAVTMRASLDNGTIEIELAKVDTPQEMTVWLVVVRPKVEVEVRAGENRGRKLTYYNVVRDLVPAGSWNGAATVIKHKAGTLTTSPDDRFAVIVQLGMSGAVAAARWIEPIL